MAAANALLLHLVGQLPPLLDAGVNRRLVLVIMRQGRVDLRQRQAVVLRDLFRFEPVKDFGDGDIRDRDGGPNQVGTPATDIRIGSDQVDAKRGFHDPITPLRTSPTAQTADSPSGWSPAAGRPATTRSEERRVGK